MGLFGGKKTYVSSTVYNLAGDEALRPNYLKTMVVGNTLTPNPDQSVSEALTAGYLSGPGIKLRQYYRWAQANYVGPLAIGSEGLAAAPQIDAGVVAGQIGGSVMVQSVTFGIADYEVWAEQWMFENHPDQFTGAWVAEFNRTTGQIDVTLPDGSTASFAPVGFDKSSFYIFATYNVVTGSSTGPVVAGATTTLGSGDAFPSTAGWTQDSYTSTPQATPAPGYTEIHGVWEKTEYKGDDGTGRLYSLKSIMYQDQSGAADGSGNLVVTRTWRIDTQELTLKEWSPLKVFIYRIGSGNAALDATIGVIDNWGHFLPPIPVRLDNQFISDSYKPDVYALASKAYKKLTGGSKFDDLIVKLNTSDKLSDMDYIYVVPGVSLNVKENSCKKYLYAFFENCMVTQMYTDTQYEDWANILTAADAKNQTWTEWAMAQSVDSDVRFNTAEPVRVTFPNAPKNMIEVNAMQADLNFDYQVKWSAITEDFGNGLAKPDATPGEVWLQDASTVYETGAIWGGGSIGELSSSDSRADTIYIYWQVDANNWKRLTVKGLEHTNFIYNEHFVVTKGIDALNDAEESGFIVPIHYDTWNTLSLVDTTQMATACIFLVINSYQVVKQKWWQTGFFQIVLFVAIVIISVLTFGAGTGLLGADLAVGTAIGFTGMMAVIMGAIANAIAAMILFKIISVVSIAAFGDKIGTIVAAIAMVVTMQVGVGLQSGQGLAQSFSHIMDPVNLLHMTEAVGNGVAHMLQDNVQGILAQAQDVLKDYNQQSKTISDLYAQNIGYDNGLIDPMSLTDVGQWSVESGDAFLTRTLMTGSDIAEFSTALISRFSDLTLSTDLQI